MHGIQFTITNLHDVYQADNGALPLERVRSFRVDNPVLEPSARLLWLPSNLIRRLGLQFLQRRTATTKGRVVQCSFYSAVQLAMDDREGSIDAAELTSGDSVVIGSILLDLLDLVFEPATGHLLKRPQIMDLFTALPAPSHVPRIIS